MNDIFNENVPLKTETPAFAKHVLPAVPSSEVYLEDCVKALKRFNDNHFDLAIVDPPYGIGEDGRKSKGRTTRTDGTIRNGVDKRNGATIFRKTADYSIKNWDEKAPDEEYFNELIRVSKIKSPSLA